MATLAKFYDTNGELVTTSTPSSAQDIVDICFSEIQAGTYKSPSTNGNYYTIHSDGHLYHLNKDHEILQTSSSSFDSPDQQIILIPENNEILIRSGNNVSWVEKTSLGVTKTIDFSYLSTRDLNNVAVEYLDPEIKIYLQFSGWANYSQGNVGGEIVQLNYAGDVLSEFATAPLTNDCIYVQDNNIYVGGENPTTTPNTIKKYNMSGDLLWGNKHLSGIVRDIDYRVDLGWVYATGDTSGGISKNYIFDAEGGSILKEVEFTSRMNPRQCKLMDDAFYVLASHLDEPNHYILKYSLELSYITEYVVEISVMDILREQ